MRGWLGEDSGWMTGWNECIDIHHSPHSRLHHYVLNYGKTHVEQDKALIITIFTPVQIITQSVLTRVNDNNNT